MKSVWENAKQATLVASLALPLLLAGCDRRAVEDDTTPSPAEANQSAQAGSPPAEADRDASEPTTAPPPSEASTSISQADALAMLVAIDEHELAAADQAIGKQVTGSVRDFADLMKADHARSLTDTTKLGAAHSTAPAVQALKDTSEADLRALDANTGAAYGKAYIDAMVRGHTDALARLDNTLLPAATDDKVRQHFTATRATVAKHLERAKAIQGTLK